jgi:hypothetical protein
MAHHGWIFGVVGVVGGYLGGILTMLYGHVGKYSLDEANKLKELIVEIRRSISALKNLAPKVSSGYASNLNSKLELIRSYDLIRRLRLVRLPSKKNVCEAAKLLPKLAGGAQSFSNPYLRDEAHSTAKKILDLLA